MTLKYKIGIQGSSIDLREMTRDEVVILKDEVTKILQDINEQIAEAKAQAYQGNYSLPDWFKKINRGRDHYVGTLAKINRWLGNMRYERIDPQNDAFIQQRKDMLRELKSLRDFKKATLSVLERGSMRPLEEIAEAQIQLAQIREKVTA